MLRLQSQLSLLCSLPAKSRLFSFCPLAPKHKLFIEGSSRKCQADGSQLVLHQKTDCWDGHWEDTPPWYCLILEDIVLALLYDTLIFIVCDNPVNTNSSSKPFTLLFLIWWVIFSRCFNSKLPSCLFCFFYSCIFIVLKGGILLKNAVAWLERQTPRELQWFSKAHRCILLLRVKCIRCID